MRLLQHRAVPPADCERFPVQLPPGIQGQCAKPRDDPLDERLSYVNEHDFAHATPLEPNEEKEPRQWIFDSALPVGQLDRKQPLISGSGFDLNSARECGGRQVKRITWPWFGRKAHFKEVIPASAITSHRIHEKAGARAPE